MATPPENSGTGQGVFDGFEYPDANYIYCPNQLFDLALPLLTLHQWRLLCYLFYRTLSIVDRDGNPVRQDISLSRTTLQKEARINRQMITPTLQRLVELGMITQTTQAIPNSYQGKGTAADYRLNWAVPKEPYTDNIHYFSGFFTGAGHRTPIPKAFFTQIVRNENHATNKIVATVLRHTVGFQNQFGGRIDNAPLSFEFIKRFANIKSDSTVSEAIKTSVGENYIECTEKGKFSFDPKQQKAACYRVRWSKGTKSEAAGEGENCGAKRGRNPKQQGDEICSSDRHKSAVAEGDDFRSNKTSSSQNKQQTDAEYDKYLKLLLAQGFAKSVATRLIEQADRGVIERQIEYLPYRGPVSNPLGYLRKAILEDWSIPERLAQKQKREAHWKKEEEKAIQDELTTSLAQRNRQEQRKRLLTIWESLEQAQREKAKQQAIKCETSKTLKNILSRKSVKEDHPPSQFLQQLATANFHQENSPQKKNKDLLDDSKTVL